MEQNKLVEYLQKCDDAYYNTSNPIVSDSTYDALVETLRRLDPKNPYLSKVGAKVRSNKIGRLIPMGTLNKYHKDEEVKKWLAEEGGSVLLSPKYDGFAVELYYQRGRLISASTRGTGTEGEDVSDSILRIQNIPLILKRYPEDEIIIRGEAIIPTKNHEKIKELGYSAMRNAVPGIVRSCKEEALGYVDFVAYEFIDGFSTRLEQRSYWKDQFDIEDYLVFDAAEFEKMQERREELRANEYLYEIDGVVLKTDKILEDDLSHPNHMIAWKYKSGRETTVLRGVEFQMGVTGYFTPIAIFDPVEFQGAQLSRASLGNITRMKNEFKGMTIGSLIEVSRRGDIIPYVESLVLVEETGDLVEYPVKCPHCGEFLTMEDSEPHCENPSCPETLRLKICQFARSIGVKGIGDKLVSGLIEAGHLKSVADVYSINPEIILEIPRQGQSSVNKWKALQDKKLSQLELLTSYPFIDLGKRLWETVLTKFSYEEILTLTSDQLKDANLKGIGDSKINSIVYQVQQNYDELYHLGKYHGVL